MFTNKTLLITGGTGSFGKSVLKKFIDTDIGEIRIFSRDEKKQDDLRKQYSHSNLKFYIGDVRDFSSISHAMMGVDYVFHAAALKQVPTCEFFPMESIKTNVIGTDNVINAAIQSNVSKLVCLSTDKAVYPINAMGISKAMMEKVLISKSRENSNLIISGTRYGNVMGSRGSVIPLFKSQVENNQPITITDPEMTRFMMSLDDAVNLVLYAFEHAKTGEIFVQKAPAAKIGDLASAISEIMESPNHPKNIIGTRHGEKLYEVLLSREEMAIASDLGDYFSVPPDNRDLNYDRYIDIGKESITESNDYNSHNTKILSVDEIKDLLVKAIFKN